MARQAETQGLAKKKRREVIQHQQARGEIIIASKEQAKKKAEMRSERLANVELLSRKEDVAELKGQTLRDYLQAYIKWEAPIPSNITARSPVVAIREALSIAVDSYTSGKWKPKVSINNSANTLNPILEQEKSEWED